MARRAIIGIIIRIIFYGTIFYLVRTIFNLVRRLFRPFASERNIPYARFFFFIILVSEWLQIEIYRNDDEEHAAFTFETLRRVPYVANVVAEDLLANHRIQSLGRLLFRPLRSIVLPLVNNPATRAIYMFSRNSVASVGHGLGIVAQYMLRAARSIHQHLFPDQEPLLPLYEPRNLN